MFHRAPDVVVDPADPFANDKLKRADSAENLTELLGASSGPLVLGISGSWGTGKTTFLRMWQCQLEEHGHAVTYFNAWSSDFSDDPLTAIIDSLDDTLQTKIGHSGAAASAWHSAKSIGAGVVRSLAPFAIRVATQGLVDKEGIQNLLGAFAGSTDAIVDAAEDLAEERLAMVRSQRQAIDLFRDSIGALARELPGEDTKLVILVDELDRCRPTFAVEVLERIKHFFDVDGVIFVLALDVTQLSHSVKALYGQDFDAEGYLRRFLDLVYALPDAEMKDFVPHACEQVGIRSLLEGREDAASEADAIQHLSLDMSVAFDLSPRDVTQVLQHIAVIVATTATASLSSFMVVFLAFLRFAKHELYDDYRKNPQPQKLVETLSRDGNFVSFFNTHRGQIAHAELLAMSASRDEIDALSNELQSEVEDSENPSRGKLAQNLLMLIEHARTEVAFHRLGPFGYIIERIEFSSRFRR